MGEATIKVTLKGTTKVLEPHSNWLMRIFGKKIEVAKEVVTQTQYLEKIYNVFKNLGYENLLDLEVNGEIVYEDEEYDEKDFEKAVKLALNAEAKEVYHIEFNLDTTGDNEANIDVNMYSKHGAEERPMVINIYEEDKNKEEITKLVDDIKSKISAQFEVESFEVDIAEEEATEETDSEETE